MQEITILAPDDWHLHFRDGDMLGETVPATARCFKRAIVMPNLVPPVTTVDMAAAYLDRILDVIAEDKDFEPIMTLYLTDNTSPKVVQDAYNSCFVKVFKLYPAGATTNSDSGLSQIENAYPVFEAMQKHGMPWLIHGEGTDSDIDIFDREKVFIDRTFATENAPTRKPRTGLLTQYFSEEYDLENSFVLDTQ